MQLIIYVSNWPIPHVVWGTKWYLVFTLHCKHWFKYLRNYKYRKFYRWIILTEIFEEMCSIQTMKLFQKVFSDQSVVRSEGHIHRDGGIHFEGWVQVFPFPRGYPKQGFHVVCSKDEKNYKFLFLTLNINFPLSLSVITQRI